ncbi:SO2930 family diheme c-type cytochrome [Parasphingorhabdus sp. JC815]|uniref:SO2930 family diheme c-type cytochrome n=1 Tax=Parasphingorhabdus sp. JC815 TaxID=3232140 RepID=UPI00345A30C2
MRLLIAAIALCAAGFAVSAAPIHRTGQVADAVIMADVMPRKLAEFGFFTDASGWQPNRGVRLYRLNSPLFSDYAEKYRYIYIPEGQQAVADEKGVVQFPVGSALIKSFGYKIDGKDRLLETRVMLHRKGGWIALPYVWNADQTEATLKVAGTRIPVRFTDPSNVVRDISYAVPNKNQCKECHSLSGAVEPIGPKLRNLSPDTLDMLTDNDMLKTPVEDHPAIPDYMDDGMPLESRARAYLDINCAHCHNRQGSASNSGLFLTYEEQSPVQLGIGKRPVAAGRGSGGFSFAIAPGQPDESIMLYRLKSLEPGVAMPEVGRSLVHQEGAALLSEWIAAMDSK